MTDTTMFKTTAWTRAGIVKVFYFGNHHKRAIEWLHLQEI